MKALLLLILIPALYLSPKANAASPEIYQAITQELRQLDDHKSAVIQAYNSLGNKLKDYNGWCSAYGSTALRNILQFKIFSKIFSTAGFPLYHVYSNDPYFNGFKDKLDERLSYQLPARVDIGSCSLVDNEWNRMSKDPKQFDRKANELTMATSLPFKVLASNLRLIDEEKEILLELRGMLEGAGREAVVKFVQGRYAELGNKIQDLRARTVLGFELSFRAPLGAMEMVNKREIGFRENDKSPGFFNVFQRRVFYVNQLRFAAGKLFEVSVGNFKQGEAVQARLLGVIEAGRPSQLNSEPVDVEAVNLL